MVSMSKPNILAAHDINSRAEFHSDISIPSKTGNPVLDANLFDLAHRFCGEHSPEVVLEMLATTMNAAMDPDAEEHDLKIMSVTIKEMLDADRMFRPFANVRKVTCYGSARTKPDDPSYKIAKKFSREMTKRGYMVITGGGPGIMQACNEGAGEKNSFGLNITLPYEQHPNHVMLNSKKMMNFYYFFTRKLNFLKQTDALVAFTGGFGTMDEIFETITLIQTGKSTVFPVVLLDPPGEMFWKRWWDFVLRELLAAGLISPEDTRLMYLSKSWEDAVEHIEHFYSRFHSYFFFEDTITLRLMSPLNEESLDWLRTDYADLMPKNDLLLMECSDDLDPQPALSELPRLRFTFRRGNYARLRMLIDAVNDLS